MRLVDTARHTTTSVLAGRHHWAMIDQGIVSVGSALTSVLLARNLSPDQFGVAVLLIAGMLFLNTVHASLVVYPLSVTGARLPENRFPQYLGRSIFSTGLIAVPLGLVLGGMAFILSSPAAVFAALALIAWQGQETMRRALFARLRHRGAIPGDVLSYIGQAILIAVVGVRGDLTVTRVFAILLLTSTIGGLVQALQVRPSVPRSALREKTVEAFRSGSWTLPSNLLGAVIMQLPIWTLGLFRSSSDAGKLQALIAIAAIANPIMFGAANMLTPAVARHRADRSGSSPARLLATSINYGLALLLPVMLVVWIWPARLLGLVYGQSSSYTSLSMPLRFLALAYLIVFLAHVGNAVLFGLERPRDVLLVQVIGVVLLIAVGIPAVAVWGVTGAVAAILVAHAARAVLCGHSLERHLRTAALRPVVAPGGTLSMTPGRLSEWDRTQDV